MVLLRAFGLLGRVPVAAIKSNKKPLDKKKKKKKNHTEIVEALGGVHGSNAAFNTSVLSGVRRGIDGFA